jgi:hypothetical protein
MSTATTTFINNLFILSLNAAVAQPGTAQAWNFSKKKKDSLFPQGYPSSKFGEAKFCQKIKSWLV